MLSREDQVEAIMLLIDFQKTSSQAFVHGFAKGLGAPLMLFRNEADRAVFVVFQVSAPSASIEETLVGDWCRVGADIRTGIARYRQENAIGEESSVVDRHVKQSNKATTKKHRSKRR